MLTITELRENKPKSHTSIELASYAFFDIETTGLRPDRGAKITEVAILNRNSLQFIWTKDNDIKSDDFSNQLSNVLELLKHGIVVGHNIGFDLWFIAYESDRIGLNGPNIWFIDTLSLARKVLKRKKGYQLSSLLKEFEIQINGKLHSAVVDAAASRALFWKLIEYGGISTITEAGVKQLNWGSF